MCFLRGGAIDGILPGGEDYQNPFIEQGLPARYPIGVLQLLNGGRRTL